MNRRPRLPGADELFRSTGGSRALSNGARSGGARRMPRSRSLTRRRPFWRTWAGSAPS